MQVWELIRELRKFDGKLMVVVDGEDGGKAVYIGR